MGAAVRRFVTELTDEGLAAKAYIYSYPIAQNYKALWGQCVCQSPNYTPFNVFYHRTQLMTPDFHGVVTPNNDTLYSSAWLDLRAEPVVLSVPEVPTPRYYSMQLVDIYTDNFAIFGVRTTGRSAGNYLITGPYWSGDTPEGINAVVQSEGNYVLALGRTEVLQDTEEDLKKVRDIQAGYALTPLSQFLGQPSPAPQPEPMFPPFDENKLGTIDSFTYSNFLLQFVEVHPSEKELLNRFSTLGVGPGLTVDSTNVAIRKGVLKAVNFIDKCISETGKNGKSGWSVAVIPPPFGTREVLEQQPHWYLRRSVAASIGLYGQDPAEAFYPTARVDVRGAQLEGSQSQYSLHLSKDRFPPVQSFWSLTMCDSSTKGFVANPINRYSIGDRTDGLSYGVDGSLTIYIQKDNPGGEKETNWLPAPDAPFYVVMRLYWPTGDALEAPYVPPGLNKV